MTPTEITTIRTTRKALGLTQAEFAALLNISPSYVAQIEGGARKPESAIARLLSVVHKPTVANALAEAAGWSRRWAE